MRRRACARRCGGDDRAPRPQFARGPCRNWRRSQPSVTHLVGIGGSGMSAIARLLLARGEKVTGSDVKQTPLIQKLRGEGAFINIGHRPENVKGATRIIVSSAIDKQNPEYLRAAELGIPITT